MWPDIKTYLAAVVRQWTLYVTGPLATLALYGVGLLGWHPPGWITAFALSSGLPVAGFLVWRDEHGKVTREDSVLALRRGPFQEQLQKLDATALLILRRLVSYGRLSSVQAGQYLKERGVVVGGAVGDNTAQAEWVLRGIEQKTPLIEMQASGFWQMSPEMAPLLVEWARESQAQ